MSGSDFKKLSVANQLPLQQNAGGLLLPVEYHSPKEKYL
jgi:hypothetical protein